LSDARLVLQPSILFEADGTVELGRRIALDGRVRARLNARSVAFAGA
jgi:hypothetical protein